MGARENQGRSLPRFLPWKVFPAAVSVYSAAAAPTRLAFVQPLVR